MNSNVSIHLGDTKLVFIGLCILLLACGEKSPPPELIVTGTVEGQGITDHPDKPIQVAVLHHVDNGQIAIDSLNDVVAIVSADKRDLSFRIDLGDSGLHPGDRINLAAFVDVNASADRLPDPDPGDYVGFYMDRDTFTPAYTLTGGVNAGFQIDINRLIRPCTAQITGRVTENLSGDLMIVAYAGEINSFDFNEFDSDEIIGYLRLTKGAAEIAYAMEVLPYPQGLTADHVYIIAFLDEDGSGMPNPGNLVGFHAGANGTLPQLVTIDPGRDVVLSGIDIDLRFPDATGQRTVEIRIPEPSGDTIVLYGQFNPPIDFEPAQGAVFMLVADADNLSDVVVSPLSSIAYFYRMPAGETQFSLDLSDTGLSLSDEVMVMALWDRDFVAGFPDPTPADLLGLLQNNTQMSFSIDLSQGLDYGDLSGGWTFDISKILYDHQAAIQFQFSANGTVVPQNGEPVIAIAVAQDGVNLTTQAIDMDYVVGMAQVVTGTDGPPYPLAVLPAIFKGVAASDDPFAINGVYLFAILDRNGNGQPDAGEYLGFSGNRIPLTQIYLPRAFDIADGLNVVGNPVTFTGQTY